MSVDKGFVKLPVYREDGEPYILRMFEGENETDVLSVYDEIVLEVRNGRDYKAPLILRKSLSDGGITVQNTNEVVFNLKTTAEGGVYFCDVRFRSIASGDYKTLLKGVVPVEDNISRI